MADYDPENIFAKILRGDMPSEKVFEDDNTVAIMDIMPRTSGHVLVLPKRASRNILDIAPEDLTACLRTVQRLAKAAGAAFGADGVTIQHFVEGAGGQMVFHTHWHVLPRFEGQGLRPHSGDIAPSEEIKANADRWRAALAP